MVEPEVQSVLGFLNGLAKRDIKLWLENGQLRFKAPKGALTGALRQELKHRKAEIIAFFENNLSSAAGTAVIPTVTRERPIPLSFAQQRLWFIHRWQSGGAAYHVPGAFEVHGRLDVWAFERAVQALVNRHESLRTYFEELGEEPRQIIADAPPITLTVRDLEGLAGARQTALDTLVPETKIPFDLKSPSQFRIALYRLENTAWILFINVHHIIWDEWSLNIFLNELEILYEGIRLGRDTTLPELSIQFADYAVWQRQTLAGETLEKQLAFWRQHLGEPPPRTELPLDRPRPKTTLYRGALLKFPVPHKTAKCLQANGSRQGVTPFMTLLASFKFLLSRYSGQAAVVTGTPVANRNHPDIEQVIGFFANTLVIRADLLPQDSFRSWQARVRDATLKVFEHQDTPFEKLVETLQPDRDLSRNPLFQVMFSFHNEATGNRRLGNLDLHSFDFDSGLTHFDLTLGMVDDGHDLEGCFAYSTELFTATAMGRFTRHFLHLLNEIATRPDRPLRAVPLPDAAERHHMLREWNHTALGLPANSDFPRIFEAWARRCSGAEAVVCENISLSYKRLDHDSNRLAHWLRSLGVAVDEPVGIALKRSVDWAVAILGVMKAGAAYLPLDPGESQARSESIVNDAGARFILCREQIPSLNGSQTLNLEAIPDPGQEDWRSQPPPWGAHLAYIIYTSGTTGRPKGVAVTHASLLNYQHAARTRLELGDGWHYALVSTFAADLGNTAIFPCWSSGGTLHIVSRNRAASPDGYADYSHQLAIDFLKIVPSHLAALLTCAQPERVLPRRVLVLGGEPCPQWLVARVRALSPNTRVYNHYGPSETTVGVTALHLDQSVEARNGVFPLGRPLGNTDIYLLDTFLQPTPPNVPAQLCIGGAGLARQYWRRPHLTAEKFIPNPFVERPGLRLYQTGDLASLDATGLIAFLGRTDHQIKLRGFRIELGEIEAVLKTHAGVDRAVILLCTPPAQTEGITVERVLVAFVILGQDPGKGSPTTVTALRTHLERRLPAHMVPAAFIFLEALPLTANGKVDRTALSQMYPEKGRSQSPAAVAGPRNPVEAELSSIWADLLGLTAIEPGANFFSLGGHSLLAIQVISRVKKQLNLELSLASIFENPTIAALAGVLIEKLLAQHFSGTTPTTNMPMARVSRDGPLPLSMAQRPLWLIHQWNPTDTAYNAPRAYRLTGRFDPRGWEAAIGQVIQRHESLRTRFVTTDGEPHQIIDRPRLQPLVLIDLSDLASPETVGSHLLARDAGQPFDLGLGPLFRNLVIRLPKAEHSVLLHLHHMVSDAWSAAVLWRELRHFYHGSLMGQPASLPRLDVQYADYAVWQYSHFQGDGLRVLLAYWTEKLAGEPPTLSLPADASRPQKHGHRGAFFQFTIPSELVADMRATSREENGTLFMVLLAGFKVLLTKMSGQEDIWVGTPVANRNRGEIEGLIGFFVNTLVMRTDLAGKPSLRTCFQRVRETALAGFAHQDLPFEKLVETLQPERQTGRNPLFQVMFVLQNAGADDHSLNGLKVRPEPITTHTTHFDLTLLVGEAPLGQDLAAAIEYSTELFAVTTILRLALHYLDILRLMVMDPQLSLSCLEIGDAAQKHQILREWNSPETSFPGGGHAIHQIFRTTAGTCPQSVALEMDGHLLTYECLNRVSDALCSHLRDRGIGPGKVVGLGQDRGLEVVVSILGVLKGGAAYLPLDPSQPEDRIRFLLEDAAVTLVLTHKTWFPTLPKGPWQTLKPPIESHPEPPCSPADTGDLPHLAYLMYTSGSTGKPKGVCIPHQAVVRLVRDTGYCEFRDEVFLQFAPLGFDAATFEIWGPLLNGSRLTLFPPTKPDLAELGLWLRRYRVTTLWLTAALFQQMSDQHSADLQGLRQLLAGGDVLPPAQVKCFLERVPHCRLINGYGPTENTTFTCCHTIRPDSMTHQGVPIGRPINHTAVFLLDADFRPAPIGAAGELFAAGMGLARAYLGRPELTAEKFVPHPFAEIPGKRVYRTGDLARFLADGTLVFLGRGDGQVKLRGFRIELGEIEYRLSSHPAVRAVVVTVQEPAPGDKRLIAYWQGEPGQGQPHDRDLRQFLKARLPAYMIPSAFVSVEAFPVTTNGKIDRRALSAIQPSPRGEFVPLRTPRTPIEEALAGIWQAVLNIKEVGIDDDFFEMGGHSLLVAKVLARVRVVFQTELSPASFFANPNLAAQAGEIERSRRKGLPEKDRSIPATDRARPLPLSFAQQRMWFLHQWDSQTAAYHISHSFQLRGPFSFEAWEAGLNQLHYRHEILRTSFPNAGDGARQCIEAPNPRRCTLVESLGNAEVGKHHSKNILNREASRPFDLARGPLFRALVFRIDAETHHGLLCMHHIVADGWSLGILLGELASFYAGWLRRRPPDMPELPIQYADFAVWQRQGAEREGFRREMGYWTKQLAGPLPEPALPIDRSRPKHQRFAGTVYTFEIDSRLTAGLTQARGLAGTRFMVLLTAFKALLARYSGQEDLLVGTPVAARGRPELEGLIGFFANTLVLRTHLSGHAGFQDFHAQVRETALAAFDHQDLPFDQLVENLQPDRDQEGGQLFQVMFTLQAAGKAWRLTGLNINNFELEKKTAHFDLTLVFLENPPGLTGLIEYRTDLFNHTTIARMADHYRNLLREMVRNPGQNIHQVPLDNEAARHQRLVEWNDSAGPFAAMSICQGFQAVAARGPHAVALVQGGVHLSYQRLACYAAGLAEAIRVRGLERETAVAVCMEPGPDLIAGLLAILMAGGAYLPIDPKLPAERYRFMLADAATPYLLTQAELATRLPETAIETLTVEEFRDGERPASLPTTDPNQLAYVIYTSGSTGRAKGVSVTHRAIMRLVRGTNYCRLDASRILLQFAPISFDASTFEVWGSLLNGGRLVSAPLREPDLEELSQILVRHRITTVFLTTALFQQMVSFHLHGLRGLKELLTGGEVATPSSMTALRLQAPTVKLIHVYGPTENTTFTTFFLVADAQLPDKVPIGIPITNSSIYLLDHGLQPVPIGVAGEILNGGEGLARNYLHRPQLTAEKFIPHPCPIQPGDRLYKTGDLARFLPDGNVSFMGRIDHQVKLRGFRIEPGEIEARLTEHSHVKTALVLVREDVPGDKRLVAYLRVHEPVSAQILREFLKKSLPEYMIPAAIVFLDRFPLTANGKIDRGALLIPRVRGGKAAGKPQTPIEAALAAIWSEVLPGAHPEIHDNFFDLGGHSLMATRVVTRIRETFRVDLPLRKFFETPQIASLARLIAYQTTTIDSLNEPPIIPVARGPNLPLSLPQRRLWFLDRLAPKQIPFNIPLALEWQGPFGGMALERSLHFLYSRHEALRTRFVARDGVPFQRIGKSPAWPLAWIDLGEIDPPMRSREIVKRATAEWMTPFNLTAEPLFRWAVMHGDAERHVLLITFHHIIADGWSLTLFIKELSQCYRAQLEGSLPDLEPLAIQYADFAVWQQNWVEDGSLAAQRDYWVNQLHGRLAVLPTDKPRPETPSLQGMRRPLRFPRKLSAQLQRRGRQADATLFMTLLAAFKVLLWGYSGQEDVLVGTTVANRNRSRTENVFGFFVNTLVLRTDLSERPTFGQLLRRIRGTTLGAYAHQDLPFDQLVEILRPERVASRNPLFQAMFTFQNLPETEWRFPGLAMQTIELKKTLSFFDLTLALQDSAEGLGGVLVYQPDLYFEKTIDAMATHLEAILDTMATSLEKPIATHAWLTPAERKHRLIWFDDVQNAPHGEKNAIGLVPSHGGSMAIGAPVKNSRAYVLDGDGNPLPAGYPGELHLAGHGLARGYLLRPDLTATAFLPDPFAGEPGARMYRSGDVAVNHGESLEYLGRVDSQIKIRGFRVELAEIEAVLNEQAGIKQAVVTMRTDVPEGPRLMAFLVASGPLPPAQELRQRLLKRLPTFMIPRAFVPLDALPLTPSGKVNHAALGGRSAEPPAPRQVEITATPRDKIEWRLVRLWRELLDVEAISTRDNFFELGGHSLLSLRLMARIEKRFGVILPVSALFKGGTIQSLAGIIKTAGIPDSPLVALKTQGKLPPLFLAHAVGGSILPYADLAKHLDGEQPVYAFEARGLDGRRPPQDSIEAMADTYVTAMRSRQASGPYIIGGWSLGGVIALEMAQQLRRIGESVMRLVLLDSWALICDTRYSEADIAVAFIRDFSAQAGRTMTVEAQEITKLDPPFIPTYILEKLTSGRVISDEEDAARINSLYKVFRANLRAAGRYVPQPYDGRVALFRSAGDEDRPRDPAPLIQSWRERGISVETLSIPGNHYSFLKPPHVQQLADLLRHCLKKSRGGITHAYEDLVPAETLV